MANQHTAALEARAAELMKQEVPLLVLVNNPQCGKPGRGYKAARKARAALRTLEARKATIEAQYREYLYSGKASYKTRQQREEKFKAALAELGA